MSRAIKGSTAYPLTQQIADTLRTHGLTWTARYYMRRVPLWEFTVLLGGAMHHAFHEN